VLKFPSVDAGGGFLIFGTPPAEIAIHDSDRNDIHQLYLMCEDAGRFLAEMRRLGIACSEPSRQRWGTVFEITLPGGGKLNVYEPHHARPESVGAAKRQPLKKSKRSAPTKRKSSPPPKGKAVRKKASPRKKARR
jgi:hypothetical protein